ncbi:transcription elongation factor [Candidatus Moduliflexus flocculans]|uniref:Transcription elongation factor n=1 Tax=Candidatus Moduliflexus flocculans TaxID=1499966 RepID=A0A0S6W409_9BACT|nr:transcription elongation factor [Candidatus Moduliflexus flocculans]
MSDTEYLRNEDTSHATEEQRGMSRRDYLLSLKKWSKIVIGGVVLGGLLAGTNQNAEAGGWVNRRGGGWSNNGGNSWANRRGLGAWIDG